MTLPHCTALGNIEAKLKVETWEPKTSVGHNIANMKQKQHPCGSEDIFCICKKTILTNLLPPPLLLWIESARGDNFSTLFDWGFDGCGFKVLLCDSSNLFLPHLYLHLPPSFLTRCPGKGKRWMYKGSSTSPHAAQSGRCQHAGNAWSKFSHHQKTFWVNLSSKTC